MELTLTQLAQLVSGQVVGSTQPEAVNIHSGQLQTARTTLRSGQVYWDWNGTLACAPQTIAALFARGVRGIVSTVTPTAIPAGCWAVVVADPQAALEQLADWWRSQCAAVVIEVDAGPQQNRATTLIEQVLQPYRQGWRVAGKATRTDERLLNVLALKSDDEYLLVAPAVRDALAPLAALRPTLRIVLDGSRAPTAGNAAEHTIWNADDANLRARWPLPANKRCACGTQLGVDLLARNVLQENGYIRFAISRQTYRVPANSAAELPAILAAIAVGQACGLQPAEIAASLSFSAPIKPCQATISLPRLVSVEGNPTTGQILPAALVGQQPASRPRADSLPRLRLAA